MESSVHVCLRFFSHIFVGCLNMIPAVCVSVPVSFHLVSLTARTSRIIDMFSELAVVIVHAPY